MICSSNLFCSVISLLVIALPAFADLSSITKNLQDFASDENVEILKAQACQDAPTLLSYTPSYKGVLKKRERKKPNEKRNQVGPSEPIRGKEKQGQGEGKRGPRRKEEALHIGLVLKERLKRQSYLVLTCHYNRLNRTSVKCLDTT